MARARPSSPTDPLDRLMGEAPALQTLRTQIRHLARFDAVGHAAVPTVVLQGETGTGKGLVARVIHDSGPRAPGPFIEVNCAAIPDTLLEAELFGVEAGAFTDAKRAKPGLFEAASGGTLFLDEIAALPLALQGKCLTAIETKRVRRVGAVVEHPLDVKLIVATQVELSGHVQAGHFRADLYHRLAVVVLELPPLRERGDDILVLARAFLQQYGAAYGVSPQRLSKAAEAWLLDYHWPGNVRELSHLLERVVLLEAATVIDPESLVQLCLPQPGPAAPVGSLLPPSTGAPLHEPERLTDALRQSGGNLARAARLLRMSRGGLRYRLHKYGLDRPPQHDSSAVAKEDANIPTLPRPRPGGGETPAQLIPPHDASTETVGLSAGWEPKPVAMLVIEATWPDLSAFEARHYEPWTLASRWEQRLAEKVAGFGGVLLQGAPSLCLVAFGLPHTLEQLPQRAVQAALAIRQLAGEVAAVAGHMASLVVRLAGHVGTLLVADGISASPRRWLAVGDTVALPVRLLGHAAPGEVLVSAPMARLTDRWVDMQARALSAGAEPSDAFLAHSVVGIRPRQAVPAGSGRWSRTPFLGRARELATLQAALAQMEGGRGQVVGMVGEPGIGKSRLVAEWRHSLVAHEVTYLEGHCWSYGHATPYLPVLDLLRAYFGLTSDDSAGSITAKVRAELQRTGMTPDEWVPYLLYLLENQAGTEALVGASPEILKAKTFEALRQLCLNWSQQHPLILAVEDLHWIDPTSEAFLARLVDSIAGAPILVLATYRPGYQPPWLDKSYATQLTLAPLSPQDSIQVVRAVLPTQTVSEALIQDVLAKAQGNPFFLEEIAQTVVERGGRRPDGGTALPPTLQLPATVQGVLAARLDRLPADEKVLLQTLAVIGHRCTRRLLLQVMAEPEEEVSARVDALQAAELVYESPAAAEPTVIFKHVLTQDVAYHSLSPARQHVLHERTAQAIEALVGERLAEHYGELAHHYSRSGNPEKAVTYLQGAGQQAADQSAYREAITHLTQGLELLTSLRESPARTRQELDLQITLGHALIATKGQAAPDVEQTFTRARVLCEQLGETPQLAAVLGGLRAVYEVRGELPQARELAEQMLGLAQREPDPARLMQAYIALGQTLFFLGEFALAQAYLDQGMALDDPTRDRLAAVRFSSQMQGVNCRRYVTWTLWYRGYPEQARQRSDEAIALARERAHPYSLAYALYHAAVLHGLRREAQAAQARAEAVIALARQQEFPSMVARGTVLRGWALTAKGQETEGIAHMHQGMDALGEVQRPYRLAILAEAYGRIGQTAEARRLLTEALALTHRWGGHFFEAEVHRLTGEVLLMPDAGGGMLGSPAPELSMTDEHPGEATDPSLRQTDPETWFRQSFAIARRQQAKSLELRAAMSLSRLWQQQGRRPEAYQLLAPIYGWFTEGFDTADLQDAKALLDVLACHE